MPHSHPSAPVAETAGASAVPPVPLRSMTGYAQAQRSVPGLSVQAIVKSVNHRYLDVHLHLPGRLDAFAAAVEKRARQFLARGHVDITVALEQAEGGTARLDGALLAAYLEAHERLSGQLGQGEPPRVEEILRFPGMLSVAATGGELEASEEHGMPPLLAEALDQAFGELNRMRAVEAQGLLADLRRRLERLSEATAELERQREGLERGLLQRMQRRIGALLGEAVPADRLLQEAALVAERSDVSEELIRLRTHLQQFDGLLERGGEVGRKLDFLLQELNREVNTVLSKTAGVAAEGLRISELGVEMKAEIEKIREQVQNLE